jgi:hypothetical protein
MTHFSVTPELLKKDKKSGTKTFLPLDVRPNVRPLSEPTLRDGG